MSDTTTVGAIPTYEEYLRQQELEGTQEDPQEESGSFGSRVSSFMGSVKKAGRAALTGAKKAYNEFEDTALAVVGAEAEALSHVPGLSGLHEAYSKRIREAKPKFTFDVDPERAAGVYGFIETATQFATGMGVTKGLGVAKGLGTIAQGAAQGAVTDFAFMDPYEDRLSNLVQQGPEWVRNPLTDFLSADKDDSALEARAKASLEGLLTGATIDGLVYGAKALKAHALLKAGKVTEEEAAKMVSTAATEREAAEAARDDVVEVVHGAEGEPSRIVGKAGDSVGIELEVASPAQAESLAAGINESHRVSNLPKEVTEEQIERAKAVSERIDSGVDPVDAARVEQGTTLNFRWVQTPEDVRKALVSMAEAVHGEREPFLKAELAKDGKTITWDEVSERAAGLLADGDRPAFMEHLKEIAGSADKAVFYVDAARTLVYDLGAEVARLSRLVDSDPDNVAHVDNLVDAFSSLVTTHDYLVRTTSGSARVLNILRKPIGDVLPEVEKMTGTEQLTRSGPRQADALKSNADYVVKKLPAIQKSLGELTREDLIALSRSVLFADGDPTRMLKAMRVATIRMENPEIVKRPDFWRKVMSFRANMMLSGPVTHETNILNNAIMATVTPLQYTIGGAMQGDRKIMTAGWDMFVGNFHALSDAVQMMRKTWASGGQSFLDPEHLTLDPGLLERNPQGALAAAINAPGRALAAADEFFKQINYRSNVRAQSLAQAREAAVARGLSDKESAEFIAKRVAEDLENASDVLGGAVNPNALQYARHNTFTTDLEYGVGKWLQKGANELPIIRAIFPFVRTPVNIFRYNLQHLPGLGTLQRQMREDIAAGGSRRALALGKQVTGSAMYSMAAALAGAGMLVGGGPRDPSLRKNWLDAGNRPYTIKVAGQRIDYRRLEPLGTALGIVADIVEMHSELSEEQSEGVITAAMAAFMASMSSKTFMIGMTDTFDAISSGRADDMRRLLVSTGRSFTPALASQTNPDSVWREVHQPSTSVWGELRGLVEQSMQALPGFSNSLEARRNLFGEKVMKPVGFFGRLWMTPVSPEPNDRVANELLALNVPFSNPRSQVAPGIDLADRNRWDNGSGQSPYDRWLELIAKPQGGGENLRARLERLIDSPSWQHAGVGTGTYPGGGRERLADRIIDGARERAFHQMLKEYPNLREDIKQARRDKSNAMRSGAGLLEAVSQ